MSAYNALARWYDRLTEDVSYSDFADFYVEIFSGSDEEIILILDLCCGTGSLSYELALRGYDLIACDSSPDMLAVAQSKVHLLQLRAFRDQLFQIVHLADITGQSRG